MNRRCIDCDAPVRVEDLDEPAVCHDCTLERRRLEATHQVAYGQAGAQYIGRQRGTRDDFDRPTPDQIIKRLVARK